MTREHPAALLAGRAEEGVEEERTEREARPDQQEEPLPERAGPTMIAGQVCPHLIARDGNWRAAWAAAEHRCWAVTPPGPLTRETQRRLCLVAAHVTCPAFIVARERRSAQLGREWVGPAGSEAAAPGPPFVRTVPLVVRGVGGRRSVNGTGARRGRRFPTGVPVMILAALALLVLSGFLFLMVLPRAGPGGKSPAPAATTTASTTSGVTASGSSSSAASATTTAAATSAAPSSHSSSPPAATQTYRVKSGDTLSSIARRFRTAVSALQQLNGISDPRRLRVGQLIRIP